MKKIVFSLLILIIFFLFACKKEESVIYPKFHYTPLFDEQGKNIKQEGWHVYAFWGDKLIEQKDKATVTHKKFGDLIQIERDIDGLIAYVAKKHIVKNPVSRAVIINETNVYALPSITSKPKAVKPPILCYILKEKKKEKEKEKWYQIECFNPSKDYQVDESTTKLYGKKWIKATDISLKEGNYKIIAAIQMSLRNVRRANKKNLEETVMSEKNKIQDILSKYGDSEAKSYADKVLEIISSTGAKVEEIKEEGEKEEAEEAEIVSDEEASE